MVSQFTIHIPFKCKSLIGSFVCVRDREAEKFLKSINADIPKCIACSFDILLSLSLSSDTDVCKVMSMKMASRAKH